MNRKLIEYITKNYDKKSIVRLKDMSRFFYDKKAVRKAGNPLIYKVLVKKSKRINCGLTLLQPGTIGREFFMTRGHYHKPPAAEVYVLLKGRGLLLIQNKDFKCVEMKLNKVYFIPQGYAHRTVNIGPSELLLLAIYPTKARHDYSKISKSGFIKKIIKVGRGWQSKSL